MTGFRSCLNFKNNFLYFIFSYLLRFYLSIFYSYIYLLPGKFYSILLSWSNELSSVYVSLELLNKCFILFIFYRSQFTSYLYFNIFCSIYYFFWVFPLTISSNSSIPRFSTILDAFF